MHAALISNIITWSFVGSVFPARSNSLERKIPRTKMGNKETTEVYALLLKQKISWKLT